MRTDKKVELLSPAGNPEGFYGAVHAGADAVYLAGSRFGARAYAQNFTTEELVSCIRYAHLFGVKVYLTVNTLVKETERIGLDAYLDPFYEAGLDAVIVQDLGALARIKRLFPGLGLHASTQMTLCSSYGARLLKDMGVSRIVPARELDLEELTALKHSTGLEVESFIHGAMCYCYSGQCLFSSILGGRSGNRGRCAQPCRLPYTVKGTKTAADMENYPLSLKDMCTIEHIPALIQAGIDSFKIEGRMKKPEYAAGVTAIYRRYVDMYYALQEEKGDEAAASDFEVAASDIEALSSLYVRSALQDGYYFKRNGRDMVTLQNPAYSGTQEILLEEIRRKYLTDRVRIPLSVEASFRTGERARVTLQAEGCQVSLQGEVVAMAQRQPITRQNVEKQLGKLGDSVFYAERITVQVSRDAFYSLKQINELRRTALAELEEHIRRAKGYSPAGGHAMGVPTGAVSAPMQDVGMSPEMPGWAILVSTLEQLRMLIQVSCQYPEAPVRRVYVEGDLLVAQTEEVLALRRNLPEDIQCMAALPHIVRKGEEGYLRQLLHILKRGEGFEGCLARSLDGLGFLKEEMHACRAGYPVRTDAGVYCWNQETADWLGNETAGFCLPYELNARERQVLSLAGLPCERIVYGRIPMMVTANCLRKTMGSCGKGERPMRDNAGESGILCLQDRYHKEFPVVYRCRHCLNIIYNSVPLLLKESRPGKAGDPADLRLDFTLESGEEMRRILCFFLTGKGEDFLPGSYTTGHERRGVE